MNIPQLQWSNTFSLLSCVIGTGEPLFHLFLAEYLTMTQNIDADNMCVTECEGSRGEKRKDKCVETAHLIQKEL